MKALKDDRDTKWEQFQTMRTNLITDKSCFNQWIKEQIQNSGGGNRTHQE